MTCPANCPACGAPITPKPDTEGYKCDYCHAVFFPGEEDDGVQVLAEQVSEAQLFAGQVSARQVSVRQAGSNSSCPLCSVPLVQGAIAKIPLLYCTQCHGLLLPMNVLPGLVDALRTAAMQSGKNTPAVQTPPDQGDLKRVIQCPQCHKRMDTHFYAGPGNVIVDTCGDCWLIWLDRGELMRIVHAPDEDNSTESNW
ncbi:MAG TPA: zf-TFIIB domain-containing protein [Terracidiphilus sp.]|jgi:Zn-finger nucleic acid-binding protein